VQLAREQHQQYAKALVEVGCKVVSLPADAALPDSVFVEDMAIVLDELAVITRPGVTSRRGETASVAHALADYRHLAKIEPPGTLEGGDVLRVGKMVYVGLSGRSNPAGIEQLRSLIAPHGYFLKTVEMQGCLHLKSAVTQVGPQTLLINSAWVKGVYFEGVDFVEVDPEEPYGANALLVSGIVIYPASFPRTRQRLEARGIVVRMVDVAELQKAEGAVTCCSLIFTS
jgi:dimethylargininase